MGLYTWKYLAAFQFWGGSWGSKTKKQTNKQNNNKTFLYNIFILWHTGLAQLLKFRENGVW